MKRHESFDTLALLICTEIQIIVKAGAVVCKTAGVDSYLES